MPIFEYFDLFLSILFKNTYTKVKQAYYCKAALHLFVVHNSQPVKKFYFRWSTAHISNLSTLLKLLHVTFFIQNRIEFYARIDGLANYPVQIHKTNYGIFVINQILGILKSYFVLFLPEIVGFSTRHQRAISACLTHVFAVSNKQTSLILHTAVSDFP